jgi:hypothetical protein
LQEAQTFSIFKIFLFYSFSLSTLKPIVYNILNL